MNIAAAIGIGRKVAKVAKKAKELYELDQKRRVRVNADVVLGRFRDDITFPDGSVRSVPDFRCDDFAIADGVFTVFETGDRAPFCDGSSLAPDRIGSWDTIKGALGHDAIYEYQEKIAAAWGWAVEDVRWLADAMFGDVLLDEAARQKTAVMRTAGGVFSRIYYWAVRNFGGIYHRAKSGSVVCLAALFLAGCVVIPDVFTPSGESPDYTISSSSSASPGKAEKMPEAAEGGVSGSVWNGSAAGATKSPDEAEFSSLDWCWGGFDGAKAKPVDGCRIGSLKVKGDGLSYKWEAGGCEKLGASSETDYSQTICALFCKVGGKWRGGKFDWISTSRRTRDLKNCNEGYGGWDKDAVGQANAYAFVIVSADGEKRTNVIKAGR